VEAFVFVYGSLKRGHEHHGEMSGARYLGLAELADHRLVLYEGSYPALTPDASSRDSVEGELYLVSEENLRRLDAFEDVPELYERRSVALKDGTVAFAYVIDSTRASRYPSLHGPWKGRP
jgi:gamma-glutamylaminecyclotransferase